MEENKEEKLTKEEKKRQKKEEKEAKKREEKARKEEQKRLKKEQKEREKELRQSLKTSIKPTKKMGHMKLKSSFQIIPSNINNFDFITNELPDNFFEEILLNEMELSEDFSIEKLSSLIKLYSQAMEYYLQMDSPKAHDYQGRMEFLLTNKDTLRKLKKQSENISINKKSINNNSNLENKDLMIKPNKSSNINKIEMKKNIEFMTDSLMFDDISDKVTEVIGDINSKGDLQATKNLIDKDLEKQNISWKEKLKKKKKGMLKNSFTFGKNKGNSFLVKSKTFNTKSSTDDKLDLSGKKLEKMKFIFNEGISEEVKEENEGEGSDKENKDQNNNKEEIADNFIDFNNFNIVNDGDEEKDEKKEIIIPRESVVDKDVTRKVDIDENILSSVNKKMDLLMKLIGDIEKNKVNEEEEDDESSVNNEDNSNNINDDDNKIISENKKEKNILEEISTNAIKVPLKFQSTYYQVESIMNSYIDDFNNFYYKNIFEHFASNLKEIYETKYKKYIDISVEYHTQIKENEHILENNDNLSEEKKAEIQQIIDSLKDEQQNQIAKIEDEFNRLIVSKVNEFKINSFKNNSGIQLLEEQLKLDIYSLINDSFYS